jgi:hypothetical protein
MLRDHATVRGIGRSALYAARRAEDITITNERMVQGRWFWTLSDPSGEWERERTPEGVGLPGFREVHHL